MASKHSLTHCFQCELQLIHLVTYLGLSWWHEPHLIRHN